MDLLSAGTTTRRYPARIIYVLKTVVGEEEQRFASSVDSEGENNEGDLRLTAKRLIAEKKFVFPLCAVSLSHTHNTQHKHIHARLIDVCVDRGREDRVCVGRFLCRTIGI